MIHNQRGRPGVVAFFDHDQAPEEMHTHDVPVASQAPADGGDRDHGRRPGTRAPSRTRTPAAAKGEDPEVGAAPPSADVPRD